MTTQTSVVSIHPYFKVHPGKLAGFKAFFPRFIDKTAGEAKCLHYDFTVSGDVVHCREAYDGADGALAHFANVGGLLGEALQLADVLRLEIHGPAAELEKMKPAVAQLPVQWYVFECGLEK